MPRRRRSSGPGYVELSTGDVFHVDYEDSGCWNVAHVVNSELCTVDIVRKDAEDKEGYTGYATVSGPFDWLDFWQSWPPEQDEYANALDNIDWERDVSAEQAARAYRALREGA